MKALFSLKCPRCRRTVTWSGGVTDRPACSRCGHRPDQVILEQRNRELIEWHRLMSMHPRRASVADLAKMREQARLSIRQASVILNVECQELLGIESGLTPVPDAVADAMARAYGCGR
jgi:hypothetical protein